MKPFFQDKKECRISRFQTLDYAPHLHSALEMGFLEKGESLIRVEGKEYPLTAGSFFIVFPNLIHSYEMSRDAEGFLAIVPTEHLSPYFKTLTEGCPAKACLQKGEWEEESLKILFSLAHRDRGCDTEVEKGYFRVIVGKILPSLLLEKREVRDKSTLREVLTYLSAHSEENLTRGSLARAVGVSESQISHLFSEHLKISFPAYLTSLRLSKACRYLEETDLSITQIAALSGFSSLRTFNRAFRSSTGQSPGQWRKK